MLAYDPATNPLNNNEWSFPLAECFHIAAFAMAVGTISVIDLRILGLALPNQKPSQLLKDTHLWTMAGLIITITAGMVIFTTGPLGYYYSDAFRFKIACLVVAIVYNYTIHRKIAAADNTGAVGKIVALISLLLWISIVFAGLFYAFT